MLLPNENLVEIARASPRVHKLLVAAIKTLLSHRSGRPISIDEARRIASVHDLTSAAIVFGELQGTHEAVLDRRLREALIASEIQLRGGKPSPAEVAGVIRVRQKIFDTYEQSSQTRERREDGIHHLLATQAESSAWMRSHLHFIRRIETLYHTRRSQLEVLGLAPSTLGKAVTELNSLFETSLYAAFHCE